MKPREELRQKRLFHWLHRIARWTDDYYIDALAGFVPYVGDTVGTLSALPFVWYSAFHVRSLPLTLAVINNALRDQLLGMIPFFIGDLIDFLHRANTQNLQMIVGYVDGDTKIISEVNRKAWQSAALIIVFLILIALMVWLLLHVVHHLHQLLP